MSAAHANENLNMSDSQNYSMNTTTRTVQDKRNFKIAFMENENKNLMQMVDDLQTSLKINKGIIKNLLDQKKSLNSCVEYTFNQLNHENEMIENKLKRVQDERDELQARIFIMQQIIDNTKDKEDDVAEIYKDEIEELKENLERKEYLLQVNEQRYSEFEKILMQQAEVDDNVRRRLADINLVPKDRTISNVVLENTNYKQQIEELKYENEKLRDQMEQIANYGQNFNQEELSIFQTKNPYNMPKLDLGKLQKQERDQSEYIKKLEQSVQYLNEKIQKLRIEHKHMKKDNQNLKDSNENNIFINEKLNQALKKSSKRVEDLENLLEQNGLSKSIKKSTKKDIEMIPKKQESKENTAESSSNSEQVVQQQPQQPPARLPKAGTQKQEIQMTGAESSFGDVSSIMIMPDQIYGNNFNLLDDEDDQSKQKNH